jgi:hypothetical protein
MATTLLCQVTLTRTNNIPADAVMNTWHFFSDSVDRVDDAILAQAALETFYNDVEAVFSQLMTGDIDYKFYDLVDPTPRTPFHLGAGTFTPQGGTALPGECAICMSYNGTAISGIPAGRRRGRIFLGCLDADVITMETGEARIDSGITSIVATAGETLTNAGDESNFRWAVFSPTLAGALPWSAGDLLGATLQVETGHVDNAFDTIRSRGAAATDRTTW